MHINKFLAHDYLNCLKHLIILFANKFDSKSMNSWKGVQINSIYLRFIIKPKHLRATSITAHCCSVQCTVGETNQYFHHQQVLIACKLLSLLSERRSKSSLTNPFSFGWAVTRRRPSVTWGWKIGGMGWKLKAPKMPTWKKRKRRKSKLNEIMRAKKMFNQRAKRKLEITWKGERRKPLNVV